MDDREWIYTGWPSQSGVTDEWIQKTNEFFKLAFGVKRPRGTWCPCSLRENNDWQTNDKMGKHLCKHEFTPYYTEWTCHGESECAREDVVQQCTEDYDNRVGDMIDDYCDLHVPPVVPPVVPPIEHDPEPAAKAFYDMLSAATQPLKSIHRFLDWMLSHA